MAGLQASEAPPFVERQYSAMTTTKEPFVRLTPP
jgi:hypothetical protein